MVESPGDSSASALEVASRDKARPSPPVRAGSVLALIGCPTPQPRKEPRPPRQPRFTLYGQARWRVILYFLIGLICLDGLLTACRDVWHSYDPDDYRERLDICRQQARDLVVVGGSPVSEGIDPDLLCGVRWHGLPIEHTYNLGLPGATTSEVWHAVKHGLRAPPRVLLYGISASDLNESRYEPHGARSLMDSGDLVEWMTARPDSAEWAARHFIEERAQEIWQLWRYRNALRLWAADRVEEHWPGAFPQAVAEARRNLRKAGALRRGTGFAPDERLREQRLDEMRAASRIGPRFHFLENYRIGGHLDYLHCLLDWADTRQVAVVLVDMPVSADLEEGLHPQAFALFREALGDVALCRHVPVLHAGRRAVGLEDRDFADLIHLNAHGTVRLSAWLRRALDDLGN
jgi:hypothetical protein